MWMQDVTLTNLLITAFNNIECYTKIHSQHGSMSRSEEWVVRSFHHQGVDGGDES